VPTLAARLKFAEKHIKTKEGNPFSVKNRPWVVDEYWRPLDGFKLWPVNKEALCDACKDIAGTIVEAHTVPVVEGHREGCQGLFAAPLIVVILCLKRRSGKTFNTAGYSLSTVCQEKNEFITYMAASEDQTAQLFRENYEEVIAQDKSLSKACHVVGATISVKATHSFFECVPTSVRSVTGRGRTKVIIDEARDVPAETAMKLIPSVFDHAGVKCMRGHVRVDDASSIEQRKGELCSVCGDPLVPWYGRVLIISSAGLVDGGEYDWFAELVEELQANPHPNYHVYMSTEDVNPSVSATTMGAVGDVFGKLETTGQYMGVELSNVSRRKGEEFTSKDEIKRCIDKRLTNQEGSMRPSVAFLDTSLTNDKTSLVIVADDLEVRQAFNERRQALLTSDPPSAPPEAMPWSRLMTERIDFWDPKLMPGGIIDERIIQAHLDLYMPLFPGLTGLWVDTRIMPWAMRTVKFCRANRPWGKKVHDFNGGPDERNAGWTVMAEHLKAATLRLIDHPELRAELLAVKPVKKLNNQTEIRDRNRKVRHADIAEGLAECCRRAFLLMTEKRTSLADVQRKSSAQVLLQRTYRSSVRGLNPNSY
jgi:hypothetical protein